MVDMRYACEFQRGIPRGRFSMLRRSILRFAALPAFFLFYGFGFQTLPLSAQASKDSRGIFEGQSDIGSVTPPGKAAYDPAADAYIIASAGANLWSTADDFHFIWKRVAGDVSLTADIGFPVVAGVHDPHRKAILIFRQSLDTGSIYADTAQHGSGLTALQYRRAPGATTQDIELNIEAPRRVRLEKRGDTITLFLSRNGEPLHQVGASIKLHLEGPFYAGLGVCAHNRNAVEKGAFSKVELKQLTPPSVPAKLALYSTLQTIEIHEDARRATVVHTQRAHFEAPNWTRDSKFLIFNQDGRMWKIPVSGGTPEPIDIGAADDCTGSHGLSPDGQLLAITCTTPGNPGRRVYIVPSSGGAPRMVTERPDSYWHSWSPDGKTILFTRPNPTHVGGNIYAIPAAGGAETALTTGTGISDDPDYSPDSKYIYFNSDRSGAMEIWRMSPDGTAPQQITFDKRNNWTPHPSPDGKSVVFYSYENGVPGHPANKGIALHILSTSNLKSRVLVNIVGGSGTMNVPNWAPDGERLAFVSYQMLPEQETGSSE